jgi:hypothetical protein
MASTAQRGRQSKDQRRRAKRRERAARQQAKLNPRLARMLSGELEPLYWDLSCTHRIAAVLRKAQACGGQVLACPYRDDPDNPSGCSLMALMTFQPCDEASCPARHDEPAAAIAYIRRHLVRHGAAGVIVG